MLTTLTIPHKTLGKFHSRERMKILLGGQDTEHHYATIPQRSGLITRMIKAVPRWQYHRAARS